MYTSALLLHALKGTCALNCLAALHLAGRRPLTQRAVMDLTGFDDAAVRKGLHTLQVLGLATCTGDDRRTAWQLAPVALGLPVLLAPVLSSPENVDSARLFKEEEEKEKEKAIHLSSSLLAGETPEKRDSDGPRPPWTPDQKLLRRQFYIAFEAGDVYLQYRRSLAEGLAREDGPAWLRQSLGWICYAQRRLPHVRRGAVVFISLRDRLPCDPAYLPPPELPFEAALAWALRGGEAAPPPPDADEPEPAEPAPALPETPEEQLWQAVLLRLSREVPASTVATHLTALRLVSLDEQRCVLAAASPQSRAWLANRLAHSVTRALSAQLGRPITVEFI